MKKLSMLLTPLLVLALLLGAIGCAEEEEGEPTTEPIVLKYCHIFPEESARGRVAQLFADLVEEYTDGRIIVDMYPAGTLMFVSEEVGALQTGLVDVVMPNT